MLRFYLLTWGMVFISLKTYADCRFVSENKGLIENFFCTLRTQACVNSDYSEPCKTDKIQEYQYFVTEELFDSDLNLIGSSDDPTGLNNLSASNSKFNVQPKYRSKDGTITANWANKIKGQLNVQTMLDAASHNDNYNLKGHSLYAGFYVLGIDKAHIGAKCPQLPDDDKVYFIFQGGNPNSSTYPAKFKCVLLFMNQSGNFWASYDSTLFDSIELGSW